MQLNTRAALALITGTYAAAVVFSIQYALGRAAIPTLGGEMAQHLVTTFLLGFAAGFVSARWIGRANMAGFLIWLAVALIATLLGAILPPILSGWPITIRTMINGGDMMTGLQSLASVPALGIAFLAGAVYFNKIIAVVWVLGLITAHGVARRFRM
jgi:hypothetical protein